MATTNITMYKKIVKRGYNTKLMEDIIKKLVKGELILYLTRTGTHNDLF